MISNKPRIALVLSGIAAAGGFVWLTMRGIAMPDAAVISLCGGAILAGILVLGLDYQLERLQQSLSTNPKRILAVIAALFGLYVIYAIGTKTAKVESLAFMGVYLSIPFVVLLRDRGRPQGTWLDAITVLWIWLPIEFGLIRQVLLASMPNINFHYAFAQGLAINMGIIAFAAWRRFPGIGYRFEFDRQKCTIAMSCFLAFAAIAIPLGFAIHFIHYSFAIRKLLVAPAAFLGIYLFTAIPEELLFRGLIQNWIERVTNRGAISLLIASIIFGASHLNNGPPVPNYKYFLMATIAGVFYGFVWRRTGSLAASAITHALVDTAWSIFFR
jgi:membrane protease YdiL (CAAX protease family)